ncbi:hypothetical protein B0H11DRAFT_1924764 [Mycena galericulata]|nr:hypothetical protein B0H11DRAFT_1924764 [Mycena galericulata]
MPLAGDAPLRHGKAEPPAAHGFLPHARPHLGAVSPECAENALGPGEEGAVPASLRALGGAVGARPRPPAHRHPAADVVHRFPQPPAHGPPGGGAANPWLAIVQNTLDHKDTHVIKTVRALYYCVQRYGLTVPGEAIGVRDKMGRETHVGAGKMVGSIFVRAAGVN